MDKPWLKHYDPGVPGKIDYPDIPLHRLLQKTAARHPDYIATTLNDTDITYKELNAKVNRVAHGLKSLGLFPGDRVALVLPNSPTYVIAFYATLKIGAVVVNISVGTQETELTALLSHSDPRVIITLDIFLKTVLAAANADLAAIVCHSVFGLEKDLAPTEGIPAPLMFDDLAAGQSELEPDGKAQPQDLAVLQYTGGTTGTPKAAMLTHRNLLANVVQVEEWGQVGARDNPAVICILPFFHVFGLTACLNLSILNGYRMILVPIFDWSSILPFLKMIKDYRPIAFPAVPSLWAALLSFPEVTAYHLGNIRVPSSGGAPLAGWIQEKFTKLTGHNILQAYGLTEAASTTHLTPFRGRSPAGSVGLPLPDTDARIVDLETGSRDLPPGDVGELIISGPQVMQGYWKQPEESRRTLRNGWLYTGDLGRMDAAGFFYIVDRKDDLIITTGFNVYPSEVERVLETYDGVKISAVVGLPDRIRGQAIVGYVVPEENQTVDTAGLLEHCRHHLPPHKVPKTLRVVDEIPSSPIGKPLKKVLRRSEKSTPNPEAGGGFETTSKK